MPDPSSRLPFQTAEALRVATIDDFLSQCAALGGHSDAARPGAEAESLVDDRVPSCLTNRGAAPKPSGQTCRSAFRGFSAAPVRDADEGPHSGPLGGGGYGI